MIRHPTTLAIYLMLLACPTAADAQGLQASSSPEGARLVVDDISRFATLLESLPMIADTAAAFDSLYLEAASPGLRAYVENFSLTGRDYEEAIRAFQGMEEVYPEAVFPPTYFFVGLFRAGGLAREAGLLIAVETYSRGVARTDAFSDPARLHAFADLPHLVGHELVHIQQVVAQGLDRYRQLHTARTTLLGLAIREGSADFVARLASGGHINERAHEYGLRNEREL